MLAFSYLTLFFSSHTTTQKTIFSAELECQSGCFRVSPLVESIILRMSFISDVIMQLCGWLNPLPLSECRLWALMMWWEPDRWWMNCLRFASCFFSSRKDEFWFVERGNFFRINYLLAFTTFRDFHDILSVGRRSLECFVLFNRF